MKLSEAGTEFTMPLEKGGTYHVRFPEEDFLILVAGVETGSAGETFDHPNVAARVPQVFDLKHYQRNRGKWWSTKAGIDFFFIIPKCKIELEEKPGYSYVPIRIGTESYNINVSGGTFPEGDWTDIVRQGSHIGIKHPLKSLRNLAKAAISPEVCEAKGISFPLHRTHREEEYLELLAKKTVQKKLDIGMRLILKAGSTYGGSRGPFRIEAKHGRRRRFICKDAWGGFRVPYRCIGWKETAKENGIDITMPETINRIGEVLEPAEK